MASIYIDFAYEEEDEDPKTANTIMPESLFSLGSKVKIYEANLVFHGEKGKQLQGNLQTIIHIFFYCEADKIGDCELAAELIPCVLDRRKRRRSKRLGNSGYYMRLPRICLIRCDSVKFEKYTKWQEILEEILKAEKNICSRVIENDNIFDKFQPAGGREPSNVTARLQFTTRNSTCLSKKIAGVKQSKDLVVYENVCYRSESDRLPDGDGELIIGTAKFPVHSSSNCSSNHDDTSNGNDHFTQHSDKDKQDHLGSITEANITQCVPVSGYQGSETRKKSTQHKSDTDNKVQNIKSSGKPQHHDPTEQQPIKSVQQPGRKGFQKIEAPVSALSASTDQGVSDTVHSHSHRGDRTCNTKMEPDVIIIDSEDKTEAPMISVDLTIDDSDVGSMYTDLSSSEEAQEKHSTDKPTGDKNGKNDKGPLASRSQDKEKIKMKRKHADRKEENKSKRYTKKRKRKRDIFVVKDVEVFCGTRSWSKQRLEEKKEASSDSEATEFTNSSDGDNDDSDVDPDFKSIKEDQPDKDANMQDNNEKIELDSDTEIPKSEMDVCIDEDKNHAKENDVVNLDDETEYKNETEVNMVIDLDNATEFKNEADNDDVIELDDEMGYITDDEIYSESDEDETTDEITKDSTIVDCPKCYQRFTSESRYKSHMLSHFAEKAFQCLICLRAFTGQWNLRRHVATVHEKGWKKCPSCNYRCPLQTTMDYHIKTVHQLPNRRKTPRMKSASALGALSRTGSQFRLSCRSCNAKFKDIEGLAFHNRTCNEKQKNLPNKIGK